MKINLKDVVFKDVGGNVVVMADFATTVANLVYTTTNTLDMLEIARAIYNGGGEVGLTKEEFKKLKDHLLKERPGGFLAFIREGLKEYLDKVEEDSKEMEKKDKNDG